MKYLDQWSLWDYVYHKLSATEGRRRYKPKDIMKGFDKVLISCIRVSSENSYLAPSTRRHDRIKYRIFYKCKNKREKFTFKWIGWNNEMAKSDTSKLEYLSYRDRLML